MARKPNSNAILKNLPPELQDEIWRRMNAQTEKGAGTSYEAIRKYLADEHDIVVKSDSPFVDFFQWYPDASMLRQCANFSDNVTDIIKEIPGLNLNADKVAEIGQAVFEASAIKTGNLKGFVALQQVRIARDGNALDARKVALLEKKAAAYDEAKGIMQNKELTLEERERRMKEKFGL